MLDIKIQIDGGDDDNDYDDREGDDAWTIDDSWLMIDHVDPNWSVFCFGEKGPPPSRRFRLFSGISFKSLPPMSDGGIFCSKAS